MRKQLNNKLIRLSALFLAISLCNQSLAQNNEDPFASQESTVIYRADFFEEYAPVTVNDMVNVIPGINLAMGGGGGGGNRRGLGSGENEILINGQRVTGKAVSGRDQLSRISADQVDYIEIIRGSSENLDVRNSGQTLNVVLRDAQSRQSINTEFNMDRYHDGTIDPGAKVSVSGQRGDFGYLLSLDAEPRYDNSYRNEVAYSPDYQILEVIDEEDIRDQTELNFTSAFSYQFENDLVQWNAQYGGSNPPSEADRYITDFTGAQPVTRLEREERDFERYEWEIGGDWEHNFDNGSKYRLLGIVNDRQGEGVRERFQVAADGESEKDLYLYNLGRDRERIARTSYTFNPLPDHGLEIGVEGAQTLRNNGLRLGLAIPGTPSDSVGGLVPIEITNANSEIEEIRFETFAIHNWQLNDRMSLESTLVYEQSEITQTGDIDNSRDFEFVRPKIDYRFDITPTLQVRASIERDISQLSFSDFSASTDNSDDDKNTEQGNPDIVQEKSWVYELSMEYRLPNDNGVLNSSVYYRDVEDVIDRVDVTTDPDSPQSARGNIGDGERWGLRLGASTRLGFVGLPNAQLTANISLQDSAVTDPFLGTERRMRGNGRGFTGMGFRHDVLAWNMNYGFNFANPIEGGSGRTYVDIDDIEIEENSPNLTLFMEKKAFGGTTFRFEAMNTLNSERCRERIRFNGRTVDGDVEEIENSCSGNGRKFAIKVRRTF